MGDAKIKSEAERRNEGKKLCPTTFQAMRRIAMIYFGASAPHHGDIWVRFGDIDKSQVGSQSEPHSLCWTM